MNLFELNEKEYLKKKEDLWRSLREEGVVLWHPNDGWVKRESKIPISVTPSYPLKIKDPEVGDKIALGFPESEELFVCKVTEVKILGPISGLLNYELEVLETRSLSQ